MTDDHRRPTPGTTVAENPVEDSIAVPTKSELARQTLRQRWELASVLNFLRVFEPVIGSKMKVSGEDIEMALIEMNSLLAQLHITLLKGIPPVSKTLNASDAWITAVSKKLSMWWPWVAEGDNPLPTAKGQEISRYKELDPTIRLQILKALCEIRADQDDIVAYINTSMKDGMELACFRKDKMSEDSKGTAYWYDGNASIGYRLYKEVNKFELKTKLKGKRSLPAVSFHWETLATNLEEFRKIMDEFSTSEDSVEGAVAKTIETDIIPVLERLRKRKEKAVREQQRQERILNGFETMGVTRSCRTRRQVNYTFDAYDKAITEAIQVMKKRKTPTEEDDKEHGSNEGRGATVTNSGDGAANSMENGGDDTESDDRHQGSTDDSDGDYDDDKQDDDHGGINDDGDDDDDEDDDDHRDSSNSDKENIDLGNKNRTTLKSRKQVEKKSHKPMGSRYSLRQARISANPVSDLGAKQRLRQRPTRNTALESSALVPDSEEEEGSSSMENNTKEEGTSSMENNANDDDTISDDENGSDS